MEGIIVIGVIVFVVYLITKAGDSPQKALEQKQKLTKNMICPHCHTEGSVTTRQVKQKQGISGGKAVAALFTCGITMLGTGLSRKQQMTEATCSHCAAVWTY